MARQNSTNSGNGTTGNGSGGAQQKYVIVTPQSGSQVGSSTGVVKFQQPTSGVVQVSFVKPCVKVQLQSK